MVDPNMTAYREATAIEEDMDLSEMRKATGTSKDVWTRKFLPPLGMLLTQIIMTGMLILSRIILIRGTFVYAFLTYRSIIAALTVLPLAFFFERDMLKRLRRPALWWIFINAITGITIGIGFYYYGLRDTTATYSSCFYNIIPIITFLLSVVLRIEKLSLDTKAGRMKLLGALVSVAGAMVVTLYKGRKIYSNSSSRHDLLKETAEHHWLRGTLFLIGSCLVDCFWYIGQVKLYKNFPSKYWATTLTCAMGAFQAMIVGVIIDRKRSAWKLDFDLQLLTIVYSGVLTTGVLFCITTWVTTIKGPTFASMFNSLSLVFVAILECLLFAGQELTIGSLLGITLIIGGLCTFVMGKGRESLGLKDTQESQVNVQSES